MVPAFSKVGRGGMFNFRLFLCCSVLWKLLYASSQPRSPLHVRIFHRILLCWRLSLMANRSRLLYEFLHA